MLQCGRGDAREIQRDQEGQCKRLGVAGLLDHYEAGTSDDDIDDDDGSDVEDGVSDVENDNNDVEDGDINVENDNSDVEDYVSDGENGDSHVEDYVSDVEDGRSRIETMLRVFYQDEMLEEPLLQSPSGSPSVLIQGRLRERGVLRLLEIWLNKTAASNNERCSGWFV